VPEVVSYPHYCPDVRSLRSYLLVYDRLSTIVPSCDQQGVREREAWAEINSIANSDVLGFFDPSYQYSHWFNQSESKREFERLVFETHRSKSHQKLISKIRSDERGFLFEELDGSTASKLRAAGWNYLAFQKFPDDMLKVLYDLKLAFRTSSIEHERKPVLIAGRLGDFILARLARQIAAVEKVAPVTALKSQLEDLLHDGGVVAAETPTDHGGSDLRFRRSQLLSVSLDIAIPHSVDTLRIGDFWEIRESFASVRLELNSLMDDLARSLDIDSEHDLRQFSSLVTDKRSDIANRINSAETQIGKADRRNLAIDIIVASGSSGLGSLIGGIPGAMIGAGIGAVVSKYGRSISTRAIEHDIDTIEKFAAIRNKLTRQARVEAYNRPFYYL